MSTDIFSPSCVHFQIAEFTQSQPSPETRQPLPGGVGLGTWFRHVTKVSSAYRATRICKAVEQELNHRPMSSKTVVLPTYSPPRYPQGLVCVATRPWRAGQLTRVQAVIVRSDSVLLNVGAPTCGHHLRDQHEIEMNDPLASSSVVPESLHSKMCLAPER